MPMAMLLSGCGTVSELPEDTDASDTDMSAPVEGTKLHVFADGSEQHPYETLGLVTDPEQEYDKDAVSLGVWEKPKNTPLIIRDLPENFETYVYFDMDVFFNKPLANGMRLYIFCREDENGEETYFYRDFFSGNDNWVTVSVALAAMFEHGEPDLAGAERMEIHINEMTEGLRQLYVRSVSVRQYYDGDEPIRYGEAADVFEYIVNRYAYLEFSDGKYADQKYQAAILKKIDNNCKSWMTKVNRSCTTDPFGQNYAFTSANMSTIYKNIVAMARGYATPGSHYYKNEKLRDDILYCLDFMYEKFYGGTESKMPSGANWHDSYINVPGSLTRILLALRDDLSIDEIKHYTDWMDTLIYSPSYTSANMIDMTFSIILASALQKDSVRLKKAVDTLSANVFDYVKKGDGIYEDGSYILHDNIPYTTGYGGSLLDMLSVILYTVAGSEFAFSDELVNRQVDWIFDSFEPVLFRGAAMSAVSGRIIWSNANESVRSVCIITGMARICQYAPEERAREIKSLLKYYLDANPYEYETSGLISTADFIYEIELDDSIVVDGAKTSAKVFPHMARVTTHRGDFASMLSMCSPKIARYEGFIWPTHLENCNAWYTGAGMLYVYADSTKQFDSTYHHNANHYRLPGTTVDTRERNAENNTKTFNQSSFVGGVQMDEYAMAAFQYDNRNSDFASDLVAKKSYFFFDNEYVMLGADKNSTKDEGVITTVENQQKISAATKLYLNDEESAIAPAEDTQMDGVKYAYIGGYGSIVFPEKQTLTVHQHVSGGKFIEIFFDHGVNPTDDTYSYIILPLASREEGKAYYENPDVKILSNTKEIQAVRENKLGLTGIVFWEAVEFAGIPPDFACTMLVKDTEGGKQIAISDPTMKVTGEHTIVLDGTYALDGAHDKVSVQTAGGKTTVTIDMSGLDGQTVLFKLKK